MRIFLFFPMKDQETGLAIQEGFEALGHSVMAVEPDNQDAPEIFRDNGPFDLLLCSRSMELFDAVIKIKKRFNVKTACWNMDPRSPFEQWGPLCFLFEYVDYYFDSKEGGAIEARTWNKNSHFLPQGLQEKRYYPVTPTYEQRMTWNCQCLFIGNILKGFHDDRIELFRRIHSRGVNFIHLTNVYGNEHNAAVGCGLVNIGHSIFPELKNAYSVRNWKILGAGGVCLDIHHEGIESHFKGYVENYKSIEEATEKVRYILKHHKQYKEKALKGMHWARESQTYKHRCKQLLKVVK